MQLRDILQTKGSHVHSIGPQATLAEVVGRLVKHNCGSLVVMDHKRMVGIITERDILRACAAQRAPLEHLLVFEHMTQHVVTATSSDEVSHTMGLMTEHRVRHLPVCDDDRLVGIISIGDLVKADYDETVRENHYLKSYIQS